MGRGEECLLCDPGSELRKAEEVQKVVQNIIPCISDGGEGEQFEGIRAMPLQRGRYLYSAVQCGRGGGDTSGLIGYFRRGPSTHDPTSALAIPCVLY